MTLRHRCGVLLGMAVIACGEQGGVFDPGGGDELVAGLSASAEVVEILHEFTQEKQLTLQVSLRNRSTAPITVFYEAGCPVRVRLYRPQQVVPAYDESRLACPVTTLVPVVVAANSTQTLTSGTRFPWVIHGDSLERGTYRATAVARLLGDAPIELAAGTYRLPNCGDPVQPVACVY